MSKTKDDVWQFTYNTLPMKMRSFENVTMEIRADGHVMVDYTVDPPVVTFGPGLVVSCRPTSRSKSRGKAATHQPATRETANQSMKRPRKSKPRSPKKSVSSSAVRPRKKGKGPRVRDAKGSVVHTVKAGGWPPGSVK
jgi:hypothetical protein